MEQGIPEEKILNMIRTSRTEPKGVFSPGPAGSSRRARRFLRRVPFLPILRLVLAVLAAALAFEFFFPDWPFAARSPEVDEPAVWQPLVLKEAAMGSLEAYLEEVYRTDIFGSSQQAGDAAGFRDLQQVTLAGIVFEEPPQAILKDNAGGNILYLRRGESMGELKVIEITEGKIVVEFRGEKFEMHL
ncbi:MAG: general secretion pathway protein GspB [Candidatus Omnitrophica bacterium]|nr:general secretion pathway protein GspB [Candidatus Omnitrophota bacterium]